MKSADCPSPRSDDKGLSLWHRKDCEIGAWQGHVQHKAQDGGKGPQTEGRPNRMMGACTGSLKGHLQGCPTSLTAPFRSNPTLVLFDNPKKQKKTKESKLYLAYNNLRKKGSRNINKVILVFCF